MSDTLPPPRTTLESAIQRDSSSIRLTASNHLGLFCLFLTYGFLIFALPFWYLSQVVLPSSVSLALEPQWFSPTIADGASVHYVGFVVPLIVSIASVVSCWKLAPNGRRRLRLCAKFLLVAIPFAVATSQVAVALSLVPSNQADLFIMFALSIYTYLLTIRATLAEAALLAYPLGFLYGLVSDLVSLMHVRGGGWVLGGYGLADGDFLIPLAFVIGTLLFAKTWRRVFEALHRMQTLATRMTGGFFDDLE